MNNQEIRNAALEEAAQVCENDWCKVINWDGACESNAAVIRKLQSTAPAQPIDASLIPHTYGGFRGSFYVMNNRKPTEQEIFDAGMRAGRDIQWPRHVAPAQQVDAPSDYHLQRDAFEYWFSDNGNTPKSIERSGDGYKLMGAQSAWVAWKAAYASLNVTDDPITLPLPSVQVDADKRDAERYRALRLSSQQYYVSFRNYSDGFTGSFKQASGEELDRFVDTIDAAPAEKGGA
jgi:hypothetical protein